MYFESRKAIRVARVLAPNLKIVSWSPRVFIMFFFKFKCIQVPFNTIKFIINK